ncbi:MAG: hypothetical protein F2681_06175 [Actinobacteria bacterium]|uniref:Unannotated protein n=1 Tax=freshwater metagenome TaxID=449393 RepID=A0A6J6R9L6_9ZZZZ|nr:hypothetical protein [Actinomycetota bacterium]MSW77359.1 hypothetical protein [Actinomycetota bacterium]MSX54949.1 hypothetical protein [Actinomycetota bacterium]MSZ82710.1 hypothetical protein [Actinomycetota bacterium]MTB17612.1 hypothetical protein [Actinomycetota bacterium]
MRRSHRFLTALAVSSAVLVPTAGVGHAQRRLPIHTMPTRAAAPAHLSAAQSVMKYYGGAVMTGHVNVYVVWYGNWPTASSRRKILTDFLQHVPSPYWAINQTYPNAAGKTVANDISLAGQTDDRYSVGARQLTDDQIASVVSKAVHSKVLPKDTHGVYLVLTSADVTKAGFLTQYCGWHSYDTIEGSTLKFSFIGDPSGPKVRLCSAANGSPNRDPGADAMASTIAHELDEAVTDPTMRGWHTTTGEENADRCAWQFGAVRSVAGQPTNMTLGSRNYLIQANWVNSSKPHCGLS